MNRESSKSECSLLLCSFSGWSDGASFLCIQREHGQINVYFVSSIYFPIYFLVVYVF